MYNLNTFLDFLDLEEKRIRIFARAISINLAISGWSVGQKPVGRKSKNNKAKIFPQKAKNRKAGNTIRPKKIFALY